MDKNGDLGISDLKEKPVMSADGVWQTSSNGGWLSTDAKTTEELLKTRTKYGLKKGHCRKMLLVEFSPKLIELEDKDSFALKTGRTTTKGHL